MSSAMQAAAQAPRQPWTHLQQQAVPPEQHQLPPRPQALPAAHPVEPGRQPCHMLLLRGFCPMGANCPYEHPKPAGGGCQSSRDLIAVLLRPCAELLPAYSSALVLFSPLGHDPQNRLSIYITRV